MSRRFYGMRVRTRVDADQADGVKKLRAMGCSVEIIGRPVDLLLGFKGLTILAEWKRPPGPRGGKSASGQKLRDTQADFIREWNGDRVLVLTLADCEQQVTDLARSRGWWLGDGQVLDDRLD